MSLRRKNFSGFLDGNEEVTKIDLFSASMTGYFVPKIDKITYIDKIITKTTIKLLKNKYLFDTNNFNGLAIFIQIAVTCLIKQMNEGSDWLTDDQIKMIGLIS